MLVLDNGDAVRGIAEVASKLDFTVNGYVGTAATQLADGQLGNSEGDLYASGANATVVTSITVVNTDSAARTFTLYLKPSGGTSRAITPVSLDLGISHSFYTDGQRITVMDAGGQILSSWAVDDTPVNGETDKPVSSNWAYDHENAADPHTGYMLESIIDAAGDTIYGSGDNAIARLAKGSDGDVLTLASGLPSWVAGGAGATKEFFAPATGDVTEPYAYSERPTFRINATTDKAYTTFFVPADFSSITAAVVVYYALASATHRLNFWSNYAANGEAATTHSETLIDQDTANTDTLTYEKDISGILSSLAAGDYVGIRVQGDATNTPNVAIAGVRFKYS